MHSPMRELQPKVRMGPIPRLTGCLTYWMLCHIRGGVDAKLGQPNIDIEEIEALVNYWPKDFNICFPDRHARSCCTEHHISNIHCRQHKQLGQLQQYHPLFSASSYKSKMFT